MGNTSEHTIARARTLSAGLLAPVLLLPLLMQGGLAPVLLAATVALLAGAPAAGVEWRVASPVQGPAALRVAVESTRELASLLWASAVVAEAVAFELWPEPVGVWGAVVVWGLAIMLPRWPLLLGIAGGLSVMIVCALAAEGLWTASPWTLLDPRWERWESYGASAALCGLWMSGVGVGVWSVGGRRPPGERSAPWGAVGLALLFALALVVTRAVRYEETLGAASSSTPLAAGALTVLLAAGVGSLLVRGPARVSLSEQLTRAIVGMSLALVLFGPASAARPFVIYTIVPMLVLFSLLVSAAYSHNTDRIQMLFAGVLFTLMGVLGWPGMPAGTFDAAVLGLFFVGIFWFVATRSVLAWRTA